jgi:hypothetical protein
MGGRVDYVDYITTVKGSKNRGRDERVSGETALASSLPALHHAFHRFPMLFFAALIARLAVRCAPPHPERS